MQTSPTTTVAGSPSSASAQQPVTPQTSRVARIQFSQFSDAHVPDVSKHDEFVFDLRSPISEAYASGGDVRVVQFYIGDEPNTFDSSAESRVVRTMLESVPDETDMHSILLDSGADASVFPSSMAELGCPSASTPSVLRDTLWTCVDVQLRSKRLLLSVTRSLSPSYALGVCWSQAGVSMEFSKH